MSEFHKRLADLPREQLDRLAATPGAVEDLHRQFHKAQPVQTAVDRGALEHERIEARLRKLDRATQINRVNKARIAHRTAVEAIDDQDARVRKIWEDMENARQKRDGLLEKQRAAAAQACLDDLPAPDNARARATNARLSAQIEAGEGAIALAESKRSELEAAERRARDALADELNDLIGADMLADLARVRKALAGLAPVLVRMQSFDAVREQMLGKRWSFDPTRIRPISGAAVARNFVNSIPEILRSPDLEDGALQRAAEACAESLIAEMEND